MNTMQTTIKGADHELSFWKQFVQSDRFINGWLPDRKTPELNDLVYMFLLGQPDAKVLDCGSGVVSILHGTVKRENLMQCDPLGEEYAKIFDYQANNCDAVFSVACENLVGENKFDVVHISNALDHTQDPQAAYNAMYRAVKPGGFLVVQGFVNEGTHEDWTGFHQHDLDVSGDELIISNQQKAGKILSSNPYFSKKIYLDILGRDWLIWIEQKPKA